MSKLSVLTATSLVVFLTFCCQLSSQQSLFCIPPDGYDITNLIYPNTTWQFQLIDQCLNDDNKSHECIFSFALCHPLPVQTGCNDSSVCQVSNGHNSTELGKFTINPFRVKEDEQGFLAVFEKTEPILNPITNVSCKLTFVMEFDCNKDVPWIRQGLVNLTPTPLEYSSILGENCEIKVRFDFAGACKIEPVPPTTPRPHDDESGLSAGSVFLIIFFVVLFVYLIVGSLYNKVVHEQSGLFVIPNIRFWSKMFLYSLDGMSYTWNFLTCQKKPHHQQLYKPTTYETLPE